MSKAKRSAACAMALAVAWLGSRSGAAQGAGVLTACTGPTGQVRLVDPGTACRAPETRVTWNVAGAKGDKGDPGDPASAGAGSLHVVDANGTDLGPFTPLGQSVVVPRPGHEGFWLVAPVVAQGFTQATSLSFSFKTACPAAGALHDPSQRFFSAGPISLTTVLSTGAIAAGSTFYFPGFDTEVFDALSQETTNVSTGATTCTNSLDGGFGPGRFAHVDTAPVPAALAPFKVVLK